MKKILFTGGGGAGSEAIWKNLNNDYTIFFADANINRINPNIPKNNVCKIPLASCPKFINEILKIAKDYKIDYIIPGVDEELHLFGENLNLFYPTKIVIPTIDFIKIMGDKYKMINLLKINNIKVPRTKLLSENYKTFNYPCITKPRKGRGSRLVIEHLNPQSVKMFADSLKRKNLNDFIVQEKINGPEYTIQVISDINHNIKAIVPAKIEYKKGITISASTVKNDQISNICDQIHKSISTSGIYNVQLIINEDGEPIPFEVNTRISTTFCLALNALKYDPIEMIYENKKYTDSFNFKTGIHLERHWHNYFYKK